MKTSAPQRPRAEVRESLRLPASGLTPGLSGARLKVERLEN